MKVNRRTAPESGFHLQRGLEIHFYSVPALILIQYNKLTKTSRKQIQQRIFSIELKNLVSNMSVHIHTIRRERMMYSLSTEGLTLQSEPMFLSWNKASAEDVGVGPERVPIS